MNKLHPTLKPHKEAIRPALPEGDLWIFAYGSLMWNPGFSYVEQHPALLHGFHRALCVWSHVHRGTPKHPGMVLGLDRGGSCRGYAFRIAAADKTAITEYLYAREMPTTIYRATLHPIRLQDQQQPVSALTFVVDNDHQQYAGKSNAEHFARQIHRASGISGSSREYLYNTLQHLQELGIRDQHLDKIAKLLPDKYGT